MKHCNFDFLIHELDKTMLCDITDITWNICECTIIKSLNSETTKTSERMDEENNDIRNFCVNLKNPYLMFAIK